MAALAQSIQITKAVIRFVVIHVSYSKHHLATGNSMRLIIFSIAQLASILSALESYQAANQFPFRVILFVVYGHSFTSNSLPVSGDFGDIDHPIPDQTDHRFRRKLTM